MSKNGKREFYLDLLRVFAIFAVVLLHCIDSIVVMLPWFNTSSWRIAIVLNEITRTGVPLFLMISGYLMLSDSRSADFSFFYKKRLPRLLIPLAVWCVIYYIFNGLRGDPMSVRGFIDMLINNGTSYHMWFVYTLFSIYLITPFLKKLTAVITLRQLFILIVIITFPTTLRPLVNTVAPIYIFLFNPLAEGYLGYFLLGYLLGKADLSRIMRILIIAGGALGCALGIFGNITLSSPEGLNLFFNGGYTLNHYLFAAGLFVLARTLDQRFDVPKALRTVMAKLSDSSFGIYWLHVLALTLVEEHLALNLSPIAVAGIQFATVAVGCTALMILLSFIKPLRRIIM